MQGKTDVAFTLHIGQHMAGFIATYVDSDSFTVARDKTADFIVGRRVKANCGVDGYKYGTVESSSYSSPDTTVNLVSSNDDLTSNLAEVWYGSVKPGTEGNIGVHSQDGSEGSGGVSAYTSVMAGNESFIAPTAFERKYFLAPNGANRNFNPSGSFTAGFQATVINKGGSYNIVFDSGGLAQSITPGSMGMFIYDGTNWW